MDPNYSYLISKIEVDADDNGNSEKLCVVIKEECIDEVAAVEPESCERANNSIEADPEDWHNVRLNCSGARPAFYRVNYTKKKLDKQQYEPEIKSEQKGKIDRKFVTKTQENNTMISKKRSVLKESGPKSVSNRKHARTKIECTICFRIYGSRSILSRHMVQHRNGKVYICPICGKTFEILAAITRHRKTHELNVRKTKRTSTECKICGKLNMNMKAHLLIHTNERPYKCYICDKGFNSKQVLQTHLRVHTGERPFKCQICEKTFTQKSRMRCHLRIHTGERPYKCEVCEKTFSRKEHLKIHSLRHTGERPHICHICEKSFNGKSNMKKHMRIHSGEPPHTCNICEKSFSRKERLKIHSKIHTGERPYKCNICGKAFIEKYVMTTHMKTHTRTCLHECNTCKKKFATITTLTRHLRIHSERPHKCHICDGLFKEKCLLEDHLKKHTQENAYNCDICHKVFIRKETLTSHLKNVHRQ